MISIREELQEKGLLSQYTQGEIEEIESLLMPVDTNISLDSVILSKEQRDILDDFLNEYSYKEVFMKHKLYPRHKLLFSGASGTGKTYLSKALANHLKFRMLYIDIAQCLSDINLVQKLASVFKLANHLGNCIIFLD